MGEIGSSSEKGGGECTSNGQDIPGHHVSHSSLRLGVVDNLSCKHGEAGSVPQEGGAVYDRGPHQEGVRGEMGISGARAVICKV